MNINQSLQAIYEHPTTTPIPESEAEQSIILIALQQETKEENIDAVLTYIARYSRLIFILTMRELYRRIGKKMVMNSLWVDFYINSNFPTMMFEYNPERVTVEQVYSDPVNTPIPELEEEQFNLLIDLRKTRSHEDRTAAVTYLLRFPPLIVALVSKTFLTNFGNEMSKLDIWRDFYDKHKSYFGTVA